MSNPPSGRRQRKREEKTRRLLDAAFSILDDGGIESLTMPALAERADVAVGGVYRYFEGKQDLMVALQIAALAELHAWMIQHTPSSDVAGLHHAVMSFASFAHQFPTRYALLEGAVSDPRRLLDDPRYVVVEEAVAPLLAHVTTVLDAAAAAGELTPGDAVQRALVLWGLVFGCLHHRKRDGRMGVADSYSSTGILEAGLRGLIQGWR